LVVSEAWGNIVLADHGRTIAGEPLGEVPEPVLFEVAKDGCDQCEREDPQPIPIRFRPTLANAPVTQARPQPTAATSATSTVGADPENAGPAIAVVGTLPTGAEPWSPEYDLLASGGDETKFVVEVEHDGTATLRFGDDVHGRRPETGTSFTATYR